MKYINIKIVDAVPMTAYDAMDCGYRNSDDGSNGYEVNDGRYKSWYSEEEFKKYYHEIKNKELAQTAELMVSSDYKARFIAEYVQLENRYNGLTKMNGFTVRESTTCVDPANYNKEIGKEICLKRIEDKIWLLLGYALQEKLYQNN